MKLGAVLRLTVLEAQRERLGVEPIPVAVLGGVERMRVGGHHSGDRRAVSCLAPNATPTAAVAVSCAAGVWNAPVHMAQTPRRDVR